MATKYPAISAPNVILRYTAYDIHTEFKCQLFRRDPRQIVSLVNNQPVFIRQEADFSGRFLVRGTPELHHKLAQLAVSSNVSLNQYVVQVLSEKAGLKL